MPRKKLDQFLWVEKYRPTTVSDTLLPKTMKMFFTKTLKKGEIPNLLFYSSNPGVGKTTIAKALCEELDIDYLYINTSSKSGIDTLRTDIEKYASVKSLSSSTKVVILDEFDGASINLQQGLRASIERFHNSCRFIFTANYITKMIEPLKSRCQIVDFNMMSKSVQNEMIPKISVRLKNILKFEKVDFNPETIDKVVSLYYPDIRSMLQLLQQYSTTYGNIDNNIFEYQKIDDEFYNYILQKDLTNARKYLIERSYNYDELFRELFDHFVPKLERTSRAQAILTIAEYMYKNSFVVDKEINATAMLLELIGLL